MQQAEVFWTCAYGSKVWAVLDITEVSATVQCPNRACTVTRTLPGQITELTVQTAPGLWMDVTGRFIFLVRDR